MKLFITGATGFLGSELIAHLVSNFDKIYLLVRKESLSKAKERYADYSCVSFLTGDLTNPDLIEDRFNDLLDEIDSILHMGAYYDLEGSHSECFMQNIQGTMNVLFFASQCTNLKTFHYVSTVAISGNFQGKFSEDDFFHDYDITNSYARTKWEAERLVRTWKGEAKVRIYRPGIVIGNSKTGDFSKVDGPYYFWKALSNVKVLSPLIEKMPFLPLPINDAATLPIITVDRVASLISKGLILECEEEFLCFHLVDSKGPNILNLIETSLAEFEINVKVKAVKGHAIFDKSFKLLGLPKEIIHYMTTPVEYSTNNSVKYLALDKNISFSNYKEAIFKKVLQKFGGKK